MEGGYPLEEQLWVAMSKHFDCTVSETGQSLDSAAGFGAKQGHLLWGVSVVSRADWMTYTLQGAKHPTHPMYNHPQIQCHQHPRPPDGSHLY